MSTLAIRFLAAMAAEVWLGVVKSKLQWVRRSPSLVNSSSRILLGRCQYQPDYTWYYHGILTACSSGDEVGIRRSSFRYEGVLQPPPVEDSGERRDLPNCTASTQSCTLYCDLTHSTAKRCQVRSVAGIQAITCRAALSTTRVASVAASRCRSLSHHIKTVLDLCGVSLQGSGVGKPPPPLWPRPPLAPPPRSPPPHPANSAFRSDAAHTALPHPIKYLLRTLHCRALPVFGGAFWAQLLWLSATAQFATGTGLLGNKFRNTGPQQTLHTVVMCLP